MKSILIIAAILMTGASVYGVVHFNKKSQSQSFRQLYKPVPEMVQAAPSETGASTITAEKTRVTREELNPTEVTPPPPPARKAVKRKKDRTIELKEFSRGEPGRKVK
ncbi:MAG TPA: hypothetical protein VFZ78_00380 [Flavisolibacter sp.]